MGWLCESFLSPHNGTACMVKEEGWLSWATAGTLLYIPTDPVDTSVWDLTFYDIIVADIKSFI